MLGGNVPVGIKQQLITDFSEQMTATSGFEDKYYRVIKNNNLKIPIVLLMRFKDATMLNRHEKLDLAVLTDKEHDASAIKLFTLYMQSILPELQTENKEVKVEVDGNRYKGVLELYSTITGREISRGRGRNSDTFKFKAIE